MLNLKNTDRKALINDLVKNACIMIAVHLMNNYRVGKKLFDDESVNGMLITLLGFVFYHTVFVNYVAPPL